MRLFFIACTLITIVSCKSPKEDKKTTTKSNKPSSITYVDLKGTEVLLSNYKGKKLLVNYWATWCAPCIKEMPDLLKLQEILRKENYIFLLVSDQSIDEITKFKKLKKYDFNFLKLEGSLDALGIYALPTTFIYNENGVKIKKIVGSVKWDSKEMIKTLKDI